MTGRVPAGSSARRSKRYRSIPVSDADAGCFEQARRIQANHREWLVMWSAYRRTFTAFSCFTPEPLVVDEPTADALVREMLRVKLHYSPTRIDALGGPWAQH
jgi:hypothetical protein